MKIIIIFVSVFVLNVITVITWTMILIVILISSLALWHNGLTVRQRSEGPPFNPRLSHGS